MEVEVGVVIGEGADRSHYGPPRLSRRVGTFIRRNAKVILPFEVPIRIIRGKSREERIGKRREDTKSGSFWSCMPLARAERAIPSRDFSSSLKL